MSGVRAASIASDSQCRGCGRVGSKARTPLTSQDIEKEAKRGTTQSGAAAFILCPIPHDWTDRMWLNSASTSEAVPAPVTARISLGLRDTPEAVALPDYVLSPRPALPRQKVGVCMAPVRQYEDVHPLTRRRCSTPLQSPISSTGVRCDD